MCHLDLNLLARCFYPQPEQDFSMFTMYPLAQNLAQWDLVSSKSYQFDDKPENLTWQLLFRNTTQGLMATEKLDLMTTWLSKDSSS